MCQIKSRRIFGIMTTKEYKIVRRGFLVHTRNEQLISYTHVLAAAAQDICYDSIALVTAVYIFFLKKRERCVIIDILQTADRVLYALIAVSPIFQDDPCGHTRRWTLDTKDVGPALCCVPVFGRKGRVLHCNSLKKSGYFEAGPSTQQEQAKLRRTLPATLRRRTAVPTFADYALS